MLRSVEWTRETFWAGLRHGYEQLLVAKKAHALRQAAFAQMEGSELAPLLLRAWLFRLLRRRRLSWEQHLCAQQFSGHHYLE